MTITVLNDSCTAVQPSRSCGKSPVIILFNQLVLHSEIMGQFRTEQVYPGITFARVSVG